MTVVFLHGVAGSRATYAWLPPTIAGHEVVRPDFRGHGAAARTPGAYLIADYAADAIAVLRSTGPRSSSGTRSAASPRGGRRSRCRSSSWARFSRTRRCTWASPRATPSNGAIPHFAQLRAIVPRVAGRGDLRGRGGRAARGRAVRPRSVVAGRRGGDRRGARRARLRAAAPGPTVLDTVIDGTLLAATDTPPRSTVPMMILAADDALGAAFPVAPRGAAARRRTRTSRSCDVAGAGHSDPRRARHRDTTPRPYASSVTSSASLTARAAAARSSTAAAATTTRNGARSSSATTAAASPAARASRPSPNVCVAISAASSATGSSARPAARAAPSSTRCGTESPASLSA